jgi:hypothetical protein
MIARPAVPRLAGNPQPAYRRAVFDRKPVRERCASRTVHRLDPIYFLETNE